MSEARSVWSWNHSRCKRRHGVCSLKLLKQATDAGLMFTASVAGQRRNTVRAARWNAAPIKRGFVSWSMSSMGLFLPLLVLIWAPSRIISLAFASPAVQPHRRAEPCTCDSLDLRCQHGPERPRGQEYLTKFNWRWKATGMLCIIKGEKWNHQRWVDWWK